MYTLRITNQNLEVVDKFYQDLDEARAALKEFVRVPINEYIKEVGDNTILFIEKLGKKRKAYHNRLPYEIVRGSDYISLISRENNEFILGGVIELTSKIPAVLADNTHYAHVSYDELDED